MFVFTSLACSFSLIPFVVTITNYMECFCMLLAMEKRLNNALILFSSSLSYCLVIVNSCSLNFILQSKEENRQRYKNK